MITRVANFLTAMLWMALGLKSLVIGPAIVEYFLGQPTGSWNIFQYAVYGGLLVLLTVGGLCGSIMASVGYMAEAINGRWISGKKWRKRKKSGK